MAVEVRMFITSRRLENPVKTDKFQEIPMFYGLLSYSLGLYP